MWPWKHCQSHYSRCNIAIFGIFWISFTCTFSTTVQNVSFCGISWTSMSMVGGLATKFIYSRTNFLPNPLCLSHSIMLSSSFTFNCLSFNARSLVNKLADLKCLLDNGSPDCVFVSETWLNSSLQYNLWCSSNYNLYRKDRKTRRGGFCTFIKAVYPF